MNVLIIEDDSLTAKQLHKVLKSEKYDCDVANGYVQGKEYIDKNNYSIILLDWNLGDGDGLALLKELRDMGILTPVLMLSAKSDINDRVTVLDCGGDDYLCKPYSHVELLARMRALLRRETTQKVSVITIGPVKLDIASHQVYINDDVVMLTNSEFDLLELFMQNSNVVLTRYQLSEHINKDNYSIKHSNIVDVHIKNLRKKLGISDFIQNVRGVGYKINTSS